VTADPASGLVGQKLTGQCLCGSCTFSVTLASGAAGVCHCGMCRRWSGGIFIAVDCGESVVFGEGATLRSYKGSEWGERVFCTTCGSSLLWQTQDGKNQHVSIQCFDDPGQFDVESEIFVDRKPGNYALAGQRKTLTEAEVYAQHASPEGEG